MILKHVIENRHEPLWQNYIDDFFADEKKDCDRIEYLRKTSKEYIIQTYDFVTNKQNLANAYNGVIAAANDYIIKATTNPDNAFRHQQGVYLGRFAVLLATLAPSPAAKAKVVAIAQSGISQLRNLALGAGKKLNLSKLFTRPSTERLNIARKIKSGDPAQYAEFIEDEANIGSKLATKPPGWIEIRGVSHKVELKLNHVDGIEIKATGGFDGCHSQNAMNDFLNSHPGWTGGFLDARGQSISLVDDAVVEAYPWVREPNGGRLHTKTNNTQVFLNGNRYGKSSFFPKNWNRARIKAEVEHAIKNNHGLLRPPNSYFGYSLDGQIKIEFYYWHSSDTLPSFFPLLR